MRVERVLDLWDISLSEQIATTMWHTQHLHLARFARANSYLLEISLGGLATGTNRSGIVFVDVSRGAGLEEVGASGLIKCSNKEADSVGSSDVSLGGPLVFVCQVITQTFRRHGLPVDILVVEAFVPHPLGERTRISGQAGDGDSHVVINLHYLLLVRGHLVNGALQRANDGVVGRTKPNAGRPLLY